MKTQSITLLALWASIAMAAPYKSFGENTEAPSTPEIPANGEDLPDTHSLGLDLVGGKLGEDRAGLGLALGALNDNVDGAGHGLNLDVGKLAEDRGGLELDLGKFGENGGDKHGLGLDMGKIGENKEGLSLELGKLTEGGEGIGRGVNLDIGKLGEDKAGLSLDIGKFGDNIDTSGLNLDIGKLGEDKFGLDLSIGKFGQKLGDRLRERFNPSTVTVYVPVAAPCTAGNVVSFFYLKIITR